MQSGIEYRTVRCLGDAEDLDLHIVRLDPRKWKLDTAVARGAHARSIAREKDSPFAVNANFFDKARAPLGIVVRSGELVQRPRTTSWQSIFLVNDKGRPRIVTPDKWSANKDSAFMAVQAGPRIVVSGESNKLKATYAAPRVGVCIQWDRDLMFFATPASKKLHTTEISRIARRKESQGGLACRDAMLFDGGHSVNFYVEGVGKGDNVSIAGDPVPVFVYAVRRD